MAIDLTQLPPPKVVEDIDYETLLQARKQRLIAAVPADIRDAIAATLELESEPLTLLLQENAYTEMVLRQRINEASRSTMLAYAEKEDLDNKAADYDVKRLLITPADPTATPPVEAVWEDDDRLRYRCQLAMEGTTVAGSRGAYLFHTLSASANVADAYIDSRAFGPLRPDSPAPGEVRIHVLDARGNGVPDQALLNTVATALSAEDKRPLNDTVTTAAARPVTFAVSARIEFEDGGESASGGLSAARDRLTATLAHYRRLSRGLPRSALFSALHVAGVRQVTLTAPATDVACAVGEFPLCTSITLDKA